MEPSQIHDHGLGGTGLNGEMGGAMVPGRQRGAPAGEAVPPESSGGVTFSVRAVGILHTPFHRHCPAPKHFERRGRGTLEVLPEFQPALCALKDHSHLWLLLYRGGGQFGREAAPRPCEREEGGMAEGVDQSLQNIARLALVRLLGIEGTIMRLDGLDADDGTPVLDILPLRTAPELSIPERSEKGRAPAANK